MEQELLDSHAPSYVFGVYLDEVSGCDGGEDGQEGGGPVDRKHDCETVDYTDERDEGVVVCKSGAPVWSAEDGEEEAC